MKTPRLSKGKPEKYQPEIITDGEWFEWANIRKGDTHTCCDCDLVHNIEFRVRKGKIESRWTRNAKLTREARKGRK